MVSSLAEILNSTAEDDYKDSLKEIKIVRVVFSRKENLVKLVLKSKCDISEELQMYIKDIVSNTIFNRARVELAIYEDISDVNLKEVVEKYWVEVINVLTNKIPICKSCLSVSLKKVEENQIRLLYNNKFIHTYLMGRNIERLISDAINDLFGVESVCRFILDESLELGTHSNAQEETEKNLIKKIMENQKGVSTSGSSPQKTQAFKSQGNSKKGIPYRERDDDGKRDANTIMGRGIDSDTIDIKEIDDTSGVVTIKGDLFKVEVKETKTGKKIILCNITDYTSSITVKCFPRPKDLETALEELKEGLHCKIRGEALLDPFSREVVIMGRDIVKLEKIEKMDTAEEKRVELHLHTMMSSMDAVASVSDLIKRAAKWGHPAIAITDHGVAQAYPEAMDTAKKAGIKVIYGVEAYLVNDGEPITICENVERLKKLNLDDRFVVFDIETTGFSPINDRIIEIGAVKLQNGEIVDSFNAFVNPERRIPFEITELTGITPEMVSDAQSIEKIMPKFLEFVGDSVMVAHNAEFDMSFINSNCRRMGISIDNPVLDTIPLCKFLYPDLKKYKLNVIAKYLDISLENHHSAVDDAAATANILKISFDNLKEIEIEDLHRLNEAFKESFDVKKAPTHHIILLAKNQAGLKNIYKLISISNLEYFHRRPRMPRSLIEEHKEGLIIGSACEAGELYKAVISNKDKEELEKIANFYDYIEIQPVGNNNFMIGKGIVKNEKEIQEFNRKLYELGKEMGKPVVATGDVHFMDPNDGVYRSILMASKGFSDADNQPPLYFRTTNEMLKEFDYLGHDVSREVVINNPNLIAEMVEAVKPIPDETFPPVIEGADEDIRTMCWEKAKSIYGEPLPEIVSKRLEKELNSIIGNGYAVLYLIAHKLVAKSYSDGYLVGSRGSVGSSFAATMADITEVNGLPPHYVCPDCKHSEFVTDGSVSAGVDMPDKDCPKCGTVFYKDGFDIPFETFLGFEGDKEPDIDLNFSGDNQADIHRYTEVLFGKGHTFKAGTIGTIADKTAYGYVKNYLDERKIIVTQAEIERLSKGCTGVKRTSGQHPGGIMVVPADNEIYNFCPIQRPADDPTSDIVTTHFDYHSISGRLLKLDILGHDDPTVLRMLKDTTGIDPQKVPLGDPEVLSLFTKPDAMGITREELGCEVGSYGLPEFGTKFVRQMLVDTQPKTFSDLVRISGLSHGTDVWLNNAQYFIKEGYTTLKDCISTRDDIMVYLIYKGLVPKTAFVIMEKVRKGKGLSEDDEKIMREHDVPDWYIESCKRIKYMFPKGHAVAYVMMAIRIAYFKVYYPEAYYATYFTVRADEFDGDLIAKGDEAIVAKMDEINKAGNDASNKEKNLLTTLEIVHEMYLRGIRVRKVDLYKSEAEKFIIEDGEIRMPLAALEGVGENAAKSIVEVRKDGVFISKEDLRKRSKVSKTVIEALDIHGCLEGLPETNQLSFF